MNQRREKNVICVAVALAAAVAMLTGCGSGGKEHDAIRHDMTPELLSTYQRPVDVSDAVSLTWETNNRLFWNDLGRAFYTDRPSHLSPTPIPR